MIGCNIVTGHKPQATGTVKGAANAQNDYLDGKFLACSFMNAAFAYRKGPDCYVLQEINRTLFC